MTVRYTFLNPDGTPKTGIEKLSPVQCAFEVLSEMGIGIPNLNRDTLDEWVRRADLMQAYVSTVWRNGDGTPRIFHREDWLELMPGARSNWSKRSKVDFDQSMKTEIAAYWASVDRRAERAKV